MTLNEESASHAYPLETSPVKTQLRKVKSTILREAIVKEKPPLRGEASNEVIRARCNGERKLEMEHRSRQIRHQLDTRWNKTVTMRWTWSDSRERAFIAENSGSDAITRARRRGFNPAKIPGVCRAPRAHKSGRRIGDPRIPCSRSIPRRPARICLLFRPRVAGTQSVNRSKLGGRLWAGLPFELRIELALGIIPAATRPCFFADQDAPGK